MNDILKSYSLGRKLCTNLNGYLSDTRSVEYGVAQGSVLGPLLFALYMNDLPSYFSVLNLRMYADDTILYCEKDPNTGILSKIREINVE